MFTKLITAPGGAADFPIIQNAVITSADRQSMLVIALSPATNTIGVTSENPTKILENGNQVRYTEDILRIR